VPVGARHAHGSGELPVPVKVDLEKCEGCGDCVEACATGSITVEEEKAKVASDTCCDCMACLDACTQKAISQAD
jgi:NAD-dependent dihydropyrimidine dehydrogenase PreA subunit